MAETWTIEELLSAGWSEEELRWENTAEAVMDCLANGDLNGTREQAVEMVRIAHTNFKDIDPRLGTSLANHGAALVAAGEAHRAGRTIADAIRVWQDCNDWVAAMTAPRMARSSLFHMRMEQRHRSTYEARWRVKWAELVAEARGQLGEDCLALISASEANERLARWRRECPAMLNDTRKLMAAVLLLASRKG